MRFRCIVSYRTSRSKTISSWRTDAHGQDIVAASADAIAKLKRRQRRSVTVVGMYLHLKDGGEQR